jgi:hypothetical protein
MVGCYGIGAETGAWKIDLPFLSPRETAEIMQQTFLATIGLKPTWSITAHVLHRSGVAIKCLVWGTMVRSTSSLPLPLACV